MYNECTSPSSARSTTTTRTNNHRIRSPICCVGANAVVEPEATMIGGQRTPRSPYEWLKSTAQELEELKDKCRRVKSRFKITCLNNNNNCVHHYHHHHQSHHQRHQSGQSYPGDFSYDPLSYALNFEDDVRADEDGSFPNFTARLPQSPVNKTRSATVDLISF